MSQSAKQKERDEAIERLREWIKPGDTIYTILRHVSRSGMRRSISPLVLIDGNTPDSEILRLRAAPTDISMWTARVLGCRIDRDNYGVVMSGCGMDMGVNLVYELSARLFRDGFGCVGVKCPSNDHSNGDRDYTPHGICADCKEPSHTPTAGHETVHWHSDGGYALQQRWL